MRLQLLINSSGAAITETPREELARLLREAAKKIEQGEGSGVLRDYNGNRVGSFQITKN